jgi:nucleotide-binding universal stress UspA family protein
MNIRRVLVPIDGSDNSDRALEFAIQIGLKFDAEIEIINVLTYPIVTFSPLPVNLEMEYYEELRDIRKKLLNDAHNKVLQSAPKLKVSSKALDGRPGKKILERADEGNFDMIIMGSRGLGRMELLLLGSVSREVVHGAKVPVTVVK